MMLHDYCSHQCRMKIATFFLFHFRTPFRSHCHVYSLKVVAKKNGDYSLKKKVSKEQYISNHAHDDVHY